MKIYFVQHGLAQAKEADPSRPLSAQGEQETARVAAFLQRGAIHVDALYHSGKLRARQTAAIFSQLLQTSNPAPAEGMNPNDDPQRLIDQLQQDAAMYVGHLPNIQRVVSKLVSGNADGKVVTFSNSAVACVEIQEQGNSLNWFITPPLCPGP